MKKLFVCLIALVLALGGMFSACTAENMLQFLPMETAPRTLSLALNRTDAAYGEIVLVAQDSAGERIDALCICDYSFENSGYATFSLSVHELTSGKYYVETAYSVDGISRNYMLLSLTDAGFVSEIFYYDPGYTSAYALGDMLYNGELFYSDSTMDYSIAMAAIDNLLNNAFSAEGVQFVNGTASVVDGTKLLSAIQGDIAFLPTVNTGEYHYPADCSLPSDAAPVGEETILYGAILTTGNVHVRTGPGLDYESIGAVSNGSRLDYLCESSVDERGVEWYRIVFEDAESAWVSSRYASLEN